MSMTRKHRREALIQDSMDRLAKNNPPKLFISEPVIIEEQNYPEELQEQEQAAYEAEQENILKMLEQDKEDDLKHDEAIKAELTLLKDYESSEEMILAWQKHLSIDNEFLSAFSDLNAAKQHLDKALDGLYAAQHDYELSEKRFADARKEFHEDPLHEDLSHRVTEYYNTNGFFKLQNKETSSELEPVSPRLN
ncbi:MAG: hypothetical protein P4M12_06190 [Gammaproteobacteria bacterium]|nr:hypothetical protein [Gammaproteobacteria bacterium]